MNSPAGVVPEGDDIMSESSIKAQRQRFLQETLPRFIEIRLVEVDIFNGFYLEMEQADPSPAMPQRAFEAAFRQARMVHAIWDDPEARKGTGTMLLQGEVEFCSIYAPENGFDTIVERRAKVGEITIRVPDEGAARELKRLFGDGTATLRPGEMAAMAVCIDRPRPDGTTFRQTVHVVAQA